MTHNSVCFILCHGGAEPTIGFAQESVTFFESNEAAFILVTSDGLNVEPITVAYSYQNGTGTAQGGVANLYAKLY